MSLLFTSTNLPEPTEEEMKNLMAIVMQNNCKGDWTQIGTPGISLVYYNYCTKYSGLPSGISLENRIKILEADNVLIY